MSEEKLLKNIKKLNIELTNYFTLLKHFDLFEKNNTHLFTNKELKEIKEHIGIVCFLISNYLDLTSSVIAIDKSKLDWEKKFHTKNSFLIIYESNITFKKHQKNIHKLVSKYSNIKSEYQNLSNELKTWKKKYNYESTIKNFRNKAGAHYDENFIEYYENLNEINRYQNSDAIFEFNNFLVKLINLWGKLTGKFQTELGG